MKRFTCTAIAVLIAALLIFPVGASAGRKRYQRVASEPYQTPAVGARLRVGDPGNENGADAWWFNCETGIGCALFTPTSTKDRFVSLEIQDRGGLPVCASVEYYGGQEEVAAFCERTDKPIPVLGQILVYIVAGVHSNAAPSLPTTGVVEATFTNRP